FVRGPIAGAPPVVQRVGRYVRAATSADSWSQGLFRLELLASLARENDHWQIAGELSELMLTIDPYYGGSHYALAVVARHNQDLELARREFTAAEKYWTHADKQLPQLQDAQKSLTTPASIPRQIP